MNVSFQHMFLSAVLPGIIWKLFKQLVAIIRFKTPCLLSHPLVENGYLEKHKIWQAEIPVSIWDLHVKWATLYKAGTKSSFVAFIPAPFLSCTTPSFFFLLCSSLFTCSGSLVEDLSQGHEETGRHTGILWWQWLGLTSEDPASEPAHSVSIHQSLPLSGSLALVFQVGVGITAETEKQAYLQTAFL